MREDADVAIRYTSLRNTSTALAYRQSGLTIIELMVAIALGLFLSWGAIQAFLTGKQTYTMQQALSRIQENTRTAQELIGYDVRNAGDYGCAAGKQVYIPLATAGNRSTAEDPNMLSPVADRAKAEWNFAYAVFATNNVSGSANADTTLRNSLNPPPVAGTDVLVVHTSTNLGAYVLATPAPTATTITVPARGFAATDVLSLSDCARDIIFQPTAVTTVGATSTITFATFPEVPPVDSSVVRLDTAIYYIGNNAAGEPSLYRRTFADGNVSQELLSGVENLQIEVGVDTDNDGRVDVFKAPNAVTAAEWNAWDDSLPTVVPPTYNALTLVKQSSSTDGDEPNVVAIRYSLLLRSSEDLLEAPQPYVYNGATVTPTDRRLRQVVTSTVGIRSRLN
jgi:type IV pilus assembly protein PilW